MKLTSIQLKQETKKKLEKRKTHPRESYNEVVERLLENDQIPSMEQMFREGDKIKQTKQYTTKDILKLTNDLRNNRKNGKFHRY